MKRKDWWNSRAMLPVEIRMYVEDPERPPDPANVRWGRRWRRTRTYVRRMLALVERDGPNCWLCGEEIDTARSDMDDPMRFSFDHVIPKSRGGSDALDNLKGAHKVCNERRGAPDLL